MKKSTNRIITTHVGSLPRPDAMREQLVSKDEGKPYDAAMLSAAIKDSVADVVQHQIATGIDVVNDGEQSKRSWSTYARERLGGWGQPTKPQGPRNYIYSRDLPEFAEYFELLGPGRGPNTRGGITSATRPPIACIAPLTYVGQAALATDIANLKAALEGLNAGRQPVEEAFLSAVSPGTIDHWMTNEHYASEDEFLLAIADAMRVEYEGIVNAGFVLQIDDPGIADAWQLHPEMDVPSYRKYAERHIEALNHALRNIDPSRVRLHVCWGSYHGPHKYDIELKDLVDIVLRTRADGLSIEAANPRHEHEWRVWKDTKLPEGKVLIPGVVGHASDIVEHPRLVADRIIRFAEIVGRENVIASTDCGLGPRVGHPKVAWAKFEALAEGARIATKELW
ncbi:MAG TPA: cobalamin-independent methionine synthase II family protein [Dehalococcoidia bacterium]|nr:cobalamin-independent methionine synthase II family protein [Dehalococcoidia bacterium]